MSPEITKLSQQRTRDGHTLEEGTGECAYR